MQHSKQPRHAGTEALRKLPCPAALVLMVLAGLPGHSGAIGQDLPLRFGEPVDILEGVQIMNPFDLALAPDGDLVIADYGSTRIFRLTPQGDPVWEIGRKGQGPGEFQILYRVAVSDRNEIAAVDMRTQVVSWFDGDGVFLQRAKLSTRMRMIGNVVALPERRLAIVGVASRIGRNSIRIFDYEGQQIAAFGLLPAARNERVLALWGAGNLHLTGSGDLLFTRKIPYEIYRYSLEGREIEAVDPGIEFALGPDDAFVERSDGTRVQVAESGTFVPFPYGAKDLGGGWSLAGTRKGRERHDGTWELFRGGRLVASVPAPNGWVVPGEVDRERSLLYITAARADGNDTFLQVPYTIEWE